MIAEICMLHRSVASVPGLIELEVTVLLHFLVVKFVAKKRVLPAQAFKRSLTVGESQSWPNIDPTVCSKTTYRSLPKTQNSKWEVLQPQAKPFRSAGTRVVWLHQFYLTLPTGRVKRQLEVEPLVPEARIVIAWGANPRKLEN